MSWIVQWTAWFMAQHVHHTTINKTTRLQVSKISASLTTQISTKIPRVWSTVEAFSTAKECRKISSCRVVSVLDTVITNKLSLLPGWWTAHCSLLVVGLCILTRVFIVCSIPLCSGWSAAMRNQNYTRAPPLTEEVFFFHNCILEIIHGRLRYTCLSNRLSGSGCQSIPGYIAANDKK